MVPFGRLLTRVTALRLFFFAAVVAVAPVSFAMLRLKVVLVAVTGL